jgi:polar amino acid transport system substrate-binding protein
MGFRDEAGEIVGFDVDLAKVVGERLGVEVRFQPIDWDAKVLELESGNIDMIWNGLTVTEERKEQINFSKPYFDDRQIIIVKSDSDIKLKSELEGLKIGVQLDSTAQVVVEGDEDLLGSIDELVKFSNFSEAYLALDSGLVQAVVVDELAGRYAIGQRDGAFKVLEETYGDEQMAIGFRFGEDALRDEIDRIIDEMDRDGSGLEISEKWFGEDVLARD